MLVFGVCHMTCKESIKHLQMLRIKFCVSSPYSYAAAAAEYAFGFFKAADIGSKRLGTGKR